mgnify:CR=1 FL=1
MLNNALVQVFFKDKTELFIDMHTKWVTFLDRKQETQNLFYQDVIQQPPDSEIYKRLKYTKEVLKRGEKQQPTPSRERKFWIND